MARVRKTVVSATVLAALASIFGGTVAFKKNKVENANANAMANYYGAVSDGNALANEIVVGMNKKSGNETQNEWNSYAEISGFTLTIVSGKYGSKETWQESLKQSGQKSTLQDEDLIVIEGVRYYDSANEKLSQPFNIKFNLSEKQLEQLNKQTGLSFGEQEKKAEFEKHGPGTAPLHKYTISKNHSSIFYGGNYAPKNMPEYNTTTREYSTQKSSEILNCVYDYMGEAYEQDNIYGFVEQSKPVEQNAPQKIEVKATNVGPITKIEDKFVKTKITMVAYDVNNKENPVKLITFDAIFGGNDEFEKNETAIFNGAVQDVIKNAKEVIKNGSKLTNINGNGYSAVINDWNEVGVSLNSDMVQDLAEYDDGNLKLEERVKEKNNKVNKASEEEFGGMGMN